MKTRKNFYGRRISDETRRRQNRGEGRKENYRPWIRVQENPSATATGSVTVDPYNGRSVHLLNTGQVIAWHILRYDENISEIREQFPLDIEKTQEICRKYGISHPGRNGPDGRTLRVMTSDFLVDFTDGSKKVYSVETDSHYIDRNDRRKHLLIEKTYWMDQNIPFIIITKKALESARIYCINIQSAFSAAQPEQVCDVYSYAEYLIAHHKISVSMKSHIIMPDKLITPDIMQSYEKWKKKHG